MRLRQELHKTQRKKKKLSSLENFKFTLTVQQKLKYSTSLINYDKNYANLQKPTFTLITFQIILKNSNVAKKNANPVVKTNNHSLIKQFAYSIVSRQSVKRSTH